MRCAIFSTGFSADRVLLRIVVAAWLCAASAVALAAERSRIAVFPPVDLTGRSSPVEMVQTALELSLSDRGFAPLPRAELEEFFRRHRIRHMAGISDETARAIGAETNVKGILLTTVEDWETVDPPRFAITSRWVAAASGASVGWMETSAHHGHERPGAFGLGLVAAAESLIPRASEQIAESLAVFDRTSKAVDRGRVPRRFRPGSLASDPDWAAEAASGRPLRVAVLPFVVDATWRGAGEVVASQFVRWLRPLQADSQ